MSEQKDAVVGKSWASQSGTVPGYFVEVRCLPAGGMVGGKRVTHMWSHLEFPRTKDMGVPGHPAAEWFAPVAQEGVLSYEAANALMAWAATDCDYATEFRLVKVEMVYRWEINEKGVGPAICFDKAERAATFAPRVTTPESEPPRPEGESV